MKEKVSVCIPVHNDADTIAETIQAVLNQTYKDYELVVVDNASTDGTADVVKLIKDKRIKLYRNKKNLGCGGNLTACAQKAKGEILLYIAADDILDHRALAMVVEAFNISEDIGIVTRPYYWFESDVAKPVRVTRQFKKRQTVSIKSSPQKIADVIALSDQLSGIGLRKKYMEPSFSNQYFLEMASMVLPMIKKCKTVILKDNIVAIRIAGSGAWDAVAYEKSPMMVWCGLITKIFFEDEFEKLREYLIREFVAVNYVGLVQIKNYAGMRSLIQEIFHLLRLRWKNIFSFGFWFYSLIALLVPSLLLKRMVSFYKNEINSRFLKKFEIALRR